MLRAVVGNFLKTLSEREFDAPLLAMLAAQGFTDVHFIHGTFEFGKDVVAKRLDEDGVTLRQYSIQSKAGDIGQSDWRAIRPQLEECEYNTRAHPGFDSTLPRVAVLVTTGVLKGSAPVDAQEFKAACASRGLANFELWDRETLLDWLCNDPILGQADLRVQDELVTILAAVARGTLSEPMLERHTRAWIPSEPYLTSAGRSSIETAIIANELRKAHRLDFVALLALHLYRAAWIPSNTTPTPTGFAALRLFTTTATELLTQTEPFLADAADLANQTMHIGAPITYPATCNRLIEIFSLLSLVEKDGSLHDRAVAAVQALATRHPGAVRPPSDQFAVSVLTAAAILTRESPAAARTYLREVSRWLLDSHDEALGRLGLGSMDEDERTQFERLVGGSTTFAVATIRRSSYLASVVLDAMYLAGAEDLYEAVHDNIDALRIVPSGVRTDEAHARWRRGGPDVHLQPRIDHPRWYARALAERPRNLEPLDAALLTAVSRNRHYVWVYEALLQSE